LLTEDTENTEENEIKSVDAKDAKGRGKDAKKTINGIGRERVRPI